MGSPPLAVASGFASSAQLAELWFTSGTNSILATSSTKQGWFAYGTTHRQRGGFASGAQSAELWFTSGANSNLATSSTKWGWFASGTTHRPCGGFAYGAQSTEPSPPPPPPWSVHLPSHPRTVICWKCLAGCHGLQFKMCYACYAERGNP